MLKKAPVVKIERVDREELFLDGKPGAVRARKVAVTLVGIGTGFRLLPKESRLI